MHGGGKGEGHGVSQFKIPSLYRYSAVVSKFGLPLKNVSFSEQWVNSGYMKTYMMHLKIKQRQCLDNPFVWVIHSLAPFD